RESSARHLWPSKDEQYDRILHQLNTVPVINTSLPMKLIYLDWGFLYGTSAGQKMFLDEKCPVSWCSFTDDKKMKRKANLVVYRNSLDKYAGCGDDSGKSCSLRKQIHMLITQESPFHTPYYKSAINWTATYRSDSTIVMPYGKFVFFKNFSKLPDKTYKNFALGKEKKVAWFVTNCRPKNGRYEYAEELAKYIDVDIYGGCGKKTCGDQYDKRCYDLLLNDYKFYLSFENSNCKEYITEKFFRNALSYDVLPIVMGARPEDYEKVAPPNSYIHVDDFVSPKQLASYLHKLDRDDYLYNSYFRWKGTGEFVDTKFWCRVCTMLHEQDATGVQMWYDNLDLWWRAPGTC
ncbi:hypothetical protein HELRODRAFT_123182, partial [Helobdella robusta]|uniref:Fucosyltransferase n=1 Tax=Helobdella robusta TaxID=6412 RepID=T1EGX2_HELRO